MDGKQLAGKSRNRNNTGNTKLKSYSGAAQNETMFQKMGKW